MSGSLRIAGALGIIGLLLGIAVGAYAFTNSVNFNANDVPLSLAYGQTPAGAYTVTSIHWTQSVTNASEWTKLLFQLNNAISSDALIQVTYGGTGATLTGTNAQAANTAGTCAVSGSDPYVWTCTPNPSTGVTWASVTQLAVLISQ